jgi:hypothetical protein
MTLTTHAIFGAGLASLVPQHPIAAFSLGFVSHFVLDAIPHWDYDILSESVDPDFGARVTFDRRLFLDAIRIGGDMCLGIILGLLLFGFFEHQNFYGIFVVFCGAIGAIVPDALQFVYAHFKREPLVSLQVFHQWIHTNIRLRGRPLLGVSLQIVFTALSVALFWGIINKL